MKKIITDNEIENITKELKANNKKIVLTNGCFDLLHIGHAKYLKEARSLGDALFIGINSDASVKLLKGENRPINNEMDRAELLGYFDFVDYLVIFSEKTATNLISKVKPDIYAKGGDYTRESLPEREILDKLNTEVAFINFVDGYSTTNIIKKSALK